MSRLKPFPKPVKLMEFFQDWSLPMILDFYEAERDYWGEDYCEFIDESYDENEGRSMLAECIKAYPEGFYPLLEKFHHPSFYPSRAYEEFDMDDIDKWLFGPKQMVGTKKAISALPKGFLAEWIVFCRPSDKKKTWIEAMSRYIEHEYETYVKWEDEYRGRGETRINICKKYGYVIHYNAYFIRRILLGHSLDVIFRAVKRPNLKLYEDLDVIKEKMARYKIGHEVQEFFEHSKYEDRNFTFESESDNEEDTTTLSEDDEKKSDNDSTSQNDPWASFLLRPNIEISSVKEVFEDVDDVIDKHRSLHKKKYSEDDEIKAYVYAGLVTLHATCLSKTLSYKKYTDALKVLHGRTDNKYYNSFSNRYKNKESKPDSGLLKVALTDLQDMSLSDIKTYIETSVARCHKKGCKKYNTKCTLYKEYAEHFFKKLNPLRKKSLQK